MRVIFTTLLAFAGIACVYGARPRDEVLGLPECGDGLPSPWYSGYLQASPTKHLHYVFVTSLSDPDNDPVVVWFNGGPGCSSLLALFQEHGPFVIDDGQFYIKQNPEPWNKRANIIYLESPAGVGFSVGDTPQDRIHNDMTQSKDALAALLDWYAGFPEFLTNDLYISGESYGGIYTPYLAWQIHNHNSLVQVYKETQALPLKGFIVGNGATDWDIDISPAFPEVVYNFNLIPPRMIKNYTDNGCTFYFRDVKPPTPNTTVCNELWTQINNLWQGLNWYDLFRKVYPQSALTTATDDKKVATDAPLHLETSRVKTVMVNGEEKSYKVGFTFQEYTSWLNHMPMYQAAQPLLGTFLSDYVNRPDVRNSLNIPDSVQGWSMCSDEVSANYHLQLEGSLFIYKILMQYDYKILFFSGDTDGAVPTLGTRRWIDTLNMTIKNKWRSWSTDGQVSGYIINYDGLDFATVHGVGHMAPQWKRKEVTKLFTNWLHDLPIV